MRVHRVVSRLARPASGLRHRSKTLHPTTQKNVHLSRFPVISAALTATPLFLSADSRSYHHHSHQNLYPLQHPPLILFSLSDVPSALTNAITDAYSTIRSTVLRTVHTDGSAPVVALTAVNVTVYLMWKMVPTNFMVRYVSLSTHPVTLSIPFHSLISHSAILPFPSMQPFCKLVRIRA